MARNREPLMPAESESEEEEDISEEESESELVSEVVHPQTAAQKKSRSAKPPSPLPPSGSEPEAGEEAQNSSNRARSKPIAPANSGSAKRLAGDRYARASKKSKITAIKKEKSELFHRLWSESTIDCSSSEKLGPFSDMNGSDELSTILGNSESASEAGRKLLETGRGLKGEEEWRKLRIEEMELYLETLKLRQAQTQLLLDCCKH